MKAYVYGANGAAIADIAKPEPKGSQVLVKVHTCGMNRADLGMIKGHAHGRMQKVAASFVIHTIARCRLFLFDLRHWSL